VPPRFDADDQSERNDDDPQEINEDGLSQPTHATMFTQ
jgi:hypothetical protein